jgi:hypothetical protein
MFFTLIWFICWALNSFPHIIHNPIWVITLAICLFIDL